MISIHDILYYNTRLFFIHTHTQHTFTLHSLYVKLSFSHNYTRTSIRKRQHTFIHNHTPKKTLTSHYPTLTFYICPWIPGYLLLSVLLFDWALSPLFSFLFVGLISNTVHYLSFFFSTLYTVFCFLLFFVLSLSFLQVI